MTTAKLLAKIVNKSVNRLYSAIGYVSVLTISRILWLLL